MSKKCPNKKNTAAFYALLKQFPEYIEGIRRGFQQELKTSEVNDFLKKKYGEHAPQHGSLTRLTNDDYNELIADMRKRLKENITKEMLLDKQERNEYVHAILCALKEIGITDHDKCIDVNKCIKSLPISKGRIIPQIPTDELPALLGAVLSYRDNVLERIKKEAYQAANN